MENLKEIRNELLRLHKTLLEIERESYEAEYGKVSPNQLLQLLFDHEKFSWLRTISMLIVEIDEYFADKKGANTELAQSLFIKTKTLFDQTVEFAEFKEKYQVNLNTESSVSKHHETIQTILKKDQA